jgi:DNA-binding NarL/FixJ family response regulator
MIRVIIVAPYPTIRAGLRATVDSAPDLAVVAEPGDVTLLAKIIDEHDPDVLIADIVEHDSDWRPLFEQLAEDSLLPPLVLLAGSPSEAIQALSVSRTSLLLRDASEDEIHHAIRSAAIGLVTLDPRIAMQVNEQLELLSDEPFIEVDVRLTPRELQVLAGIARGLPNKTIAAELGISQHTVKFHVGSIFAKLGVNSRSEAVAYATRQRMFHL